MRLGRQLLVEAKVAGEAEKADNKDLLSLLVRANVSPDVPVNQRMNEADVLSRMPSLDMLMLPIELLIEVPTFLLAGHETTRYVHMSLSHKLH